jgi:hypothetical protein
MHQESQDVGRTSSAPTKPEQGKDTLHADVKGSDTLVEEQANNLEGVPPESRIVIGTQVGGRAAPRQVGRPRTTKPSKAGEGTPKKIRMTEVEKLKTELDSPKKQRVLRGNKNKVEKVGDPTNKGGNDSTETTHKVKRKCSKRTTTVEKVVHEAEEFKKGDVVRLMGFEEGDDDQAVARAKVVNVAGGTLHGKTIFPGLVFVEVSESLVENYKLFASVDLDDPPVTLVGKAVGHYVLWSTEFMEIDPTL